MGKINLFLIMLFVVKSLFSQEIGSLEIIDKVNIDNIIQGVELRHNFSEMIYNSPQLIKDREILDLENKSYQEIISSSSWGKGTWGNGYYSTVIENRNIRESRGNLWALYKNNWINPFSSNSSTQVINIEKYYSDHPLIWDIGRRIIAYIHIYQYDNKEIYKNRIKEGLKYLIDNQISNNNINENGGFARFPQRVAKNNFNVSEQGSGIEEQHSAIALRALAEGYMFLNNIGDNSLNDQLLVSLKKSGEYFINRKWNVINDYQPVNASAYVVWAMTGLYKAIQKEEYLNHCIDVINHRIKNEYQRPDGSWKSDLQQSCDGEDITPECLNYQWHDSRSNYHGIILKGFAEAYSIIPHYKSDFKKSLRTAIIKSINHLINYNGKTPAPIITQTINNWNASQSADERINVNSRIHPKTKLILNFHRSDDCFNGLGACSGASNTPQFILQSDPFYASSEILQGLIYAKKNLDISNQDVEKINSLVNGIMRQLVSPNYISNFQPAIEMLTFGLYLNDDFRVLKDKNNIGLLNKTINKSTIYKNNTYNGTFLIENTINTSLQYEFATTGNFDNDENQELALFNRNGATCNGGNNCNGWISIFDITKNGDLILSGGVYTGYSNFTSMVSSDFDNDCVDEIILFDRANQRIVGYENNEYGAHSSFNIDIPSVLTFDIMETINIDNDNDKELAFYSKIGDSQGPGFVSIFKLNNVNQLTNPGAIRIGNSDFDQMKSIDYDNDGIEELALFSKSQQMIEIYKNQTYDESPIFTSSTPNNTNFHIMEVDDFDNDNINEVALYSDDGGTSNGLICKGWIAVFDLEANNTLNWTGSVCTLENGYTSLFNVKTDIPIQNCNKTSKNSNNLPENNIENINIILYPNPAYNFLRLSFNNRLDLNKIDHEKQVNLFDLQGKKIKTEFIRDTSNSLKLNLNNLKTGIYILSIEVKGQKVVKKIIKN